MRKRLGAIGIAAALVASLLAVGTPARAEAACASPDHPGGDWRSMNHDYSNTRNQDAEDSIGLAEAATLVPDWTFDANAASGAQNNEITGYPIVADGCIYVGSSTGLQEPGWIYALNADTGELVWKTQLDYGVYSTLTVDSGVVYAFVSRIGAPLDENTRGPVHDCGRYDLELPEEDGEGFELELPLGEGDEEPPAEDPSAEEPDICGPYVAALDQATGDVLWETTADYQMGADAVSSPVVYDGMVWVGVSGTAAEGEEAERFEFRGASVLIEADDLDGDGTPGELISHEWTVPDEDLAEGYSGGALWSTIAIDPASKTGFAGTGNPFNYDKEHHQTNAILKFDLDRSSPTFGQVTGSYKGDVEEYFPQVAENFSCDEEDPIGFFIAGFECGRLDVDFGASPQLYEIDGKLVVGEGQKSGVYHVVDPATMDDDPATNDAVWKQVIGIPSPVGGVVGTPAFDGERIISPHTVGGYVAAMDAQTGSHAWFAPTHDAIHWGNPITTANGVAYTPGLDGTLNAYDAATGAQVLKFPLQLATGTDPANTWGGATVARNTVYVSVGVGVTSAGDIFPSMPNGFVIAMRPAAL